MTINDIMMRDLMEEERKQQERDAKRAEKRAQAKPGASLLKWGCIAGGVLAVATALFLAWCVFSDTPHRTTIWTGRECVPAN